MLSAPAFSTQKLTVTCSPGSGAPLAGVQLSAVSVDPAGARSDTACRQTLSVVMVASVTETWDVTLV